MKHKEFFWMLAPCLLLIGAGAYFSRQASQGVSFRVVFDEVKSLPVTPRDIADGYDTRVLVKTHVDGIKRSWWRKPGPTDPQYDSEAQFQLVGISSHGSRLLLSSVKSLGRSVVSARGYANGRNEFVARFKTRGLTRSEERLDLKLAGRWHESRMVANKFYWKQEPKPLRYTYSLPLRRAGAAPPTFLTDKSPHFAVRDVKVEWKRTFGGTNPSVIYVYTALDNPINTNNSQRRELATLHNARLTTDKGTMPCSPNIGTTFDFKDDWTKIMVYFMDRRWVTPTTNRNLVFTADLSMNDCWPVPIKIVLRKNGINLAPPLLTM